MSDDGSSSDDSTPPASPPAADKDVALGKQAVDAFIASSQAQLRAKEAELIDPAVAADQAVADAKRLAAEAFGNEFQALLKKRYALSLEATKVYQRSRRLSYVTRGDAVGEHIIIDMWQAWGSSKIGPTAMQAMCAVEIPPTDDWRSAKNFADVRWAHRFSVCDPIPDGVKNVLEMIRWLQKLRFCMPRQGSLPHDAMCGAFAFVAPDVDAERAKWDKVLADAAGGVWTVFRPVDVLALGNDPAVAALVGHQP